MWGTGKPRRELLYVDDLADACVHLMVSDFSENLVNVGTGQDMTIAEIAEAVMDVVGFTGKIKFDASKPDGTSRKLLDITRMKNLGWRAKTSFEEGLSSTYASYVEQLAR